MASGALVVTSSSSSTKGDSSGLLQALAVATGGQAATSSSSSSSSKILSTTNWFTTEIQQMMYGFGDCRRSLHESAVLVEEIVHQQMSSLIVQASDVAAMRGTRFVGLEDILFLLRKDKVKLRRLLRYLELKDLKVAALRGSCLEEEDTSADPCDIKPQMIKRRKRMCYDFLASIDQTGELLALFDDQGLDMVKHERMVRAELIARNMDPQQYKEFCEARQANFSRRYKSQRFKDWLMAGINVEIKPNPQALEVISYLAYETVAQVVDLSLVVKQDTRASHSDPLTRATPPVIHNYHDLHSSSLYASQAKSAASSPARAEGFQSPPTTPTPGAGGVAGAQASVPSLSGGGSMMSGVMSGSGGSAAVNPGLTSMPHIAPASLSRCKKKRKKSGPATTLDTSWNSAIMPADIREAMRRYSADIGPFASVTKIRESFIPRHRLLCT